MKNTHHKTEYTHWVFINNIPSTDAADDLGIAVAGLIKHIVSETMSDANVLASAQIYDPHDGIVTYKVYCDYVDNKGVPNAAFEVGVAVADAFDRLGHYVHEFRTDKDEIIKDVIQERS